MMKSYKLLLLIVLTGILSGCGPIEQDIIGTWKVEKAEVAAGHIRDAKSNKSLTQLIQVDLELSFLQDGVLKYRSGTQSLVGSWELVEDDYIEVKMGDSFYQSVTNFKIVACYSDKLILEANFSNGATVVYHMKAI